MHTTHADADDLFSALRPFLLLAGIGFAVGFLGYWALLGLQPGPAPAAFEPAQPAAVVMPMALPDNPPKAV